MNTKGRIFKFFCLKKQTSQFLIWWNRGVIRFITNGVIFGRVLLRFTCHAGDFSACQNRTVMRTRYPGQPRV